MVSEWISELARAWPASVFADSVDYGLQVSTIIASKCISKLTGFRPPCWHNYSLQLHLQIHSNMACTVAWQWPPTASSILLNYGLQVHPTMACKYILKLARLWPSSLHNDDVQVHLQTGSITASEWMSEFTLSSFSGAPQIALKHHLHPVHIYYVKIGSYIDK